MSIRKIIKIIRIVILSIILIAVALGSWLTSKRATDWEKPLWIAIYPINADNSEVTQEYIDRLDLQNFSSIADFMADEAHEFKLSLSHPFTIKLAPQVKSFPPEPPASDSVPEIMWWSLRLRYWAYRANTYQGAAPHIRIFVKYFQARENQALAHSLGLQKGMLGIVNAFADQKMTLSNAVVITHEILHTLGATDKYDLQTGMPAFPDGYAEPDRVPLYPQELAEIMAGKIPLAKNETAIPRGLHQVIISKKTAQEINWIDKL